MSGAAGPGAIAGGRIPGLDGLRAVSILLVLVAHAGFGGIVPGGLGVTVFFFVSGMLITGQLVREHDATGGIRIGRFYRRRAWRLLPTGLAYVAIAGLAFVALGGRIGAAAWAGAVLDVANLMAVFGRGLDSDLAAVPHPFSILWSLAIEEQAYLVWPPLLLLLLSAGRRRLALTVAVLACATACPLLIRLALHGCGHGTVLAACGAHADDRLYKSTDTRIDSLAWGAIGALLPAAARPAGRRRAAAGAAALGLSLAIRDPFFRDTLRTTVQGAALLALVPPLARRTRPVPLLDHPAMVAIGRLSYALYLWHWLALMLVRALAARHALPGSGPVFLACYAALTIGLSLASWHGIERVALGRRRRLGSDAPARLAAPPPPGGRAGRRGRPDALPGLPVAP